MANAIFAFAVVPVTVTGAAMLAAIMADVSAVAHARPIVALAVVVAVARAVF